MVETKEKWHFFLLVLLLQTIAVTFRGILHGKVEGVTVAMTECIFDWSRETSRGDGRVRKMRTVGRDGERITSRLSCLITSTAGRFCSDVLVSGISSITRIFVICWRQSGSEDLRQMGGKIGYKVWSLGAQTQKKKELKMLLRDKYKRVEVFL